MITEHIKKGLAVFSLLVCFNSNAQLKCLFSSSITEVGGAEEIYGANSSATDHFYLKGSSKINLDSIRTQKGNFLLECEVEGNNILITVESNYDGGTGKTFEGVSCQAFSEVPKPGSISDAQLYSEGKNAVATVYYRYKGETKELVIFGYDFGAHYVHP